MQLWLYDGPDRSAVGELPDEVEVRVVPEDGPLPEGFRDVELLLAPSGSRPILDALPALGKLRVIQSNLAGVDWLLPHVPADVTVCSARGARDVPVAEWVLAAILSRTKELGAWQREQEGRAWQPRPLDELAGASALIVGYGSIGRAVERRLEPFEVTVGRVAGHARPGVHGVEDLGDLIGAFDIVVLLMPATPETEGLFDAAMLGRMKPGALLVNAGRGSAVDTGALIDALRSGHIHAALDVTSPEPLPPDHPLWEAPNLTITPHLAGASAGGERRVFELLGEQVRRYVAGEPLVNVVRRAPP